MSQQPAATFTRLRVRVEDADGPLPGDSPPAPAIPLDQKVVSTQGGGQHPAAPAHPLLPSKRPLRSHTCLGALECVEHRLMSVIPLDVARVEATIVDERLRAVETEFQSLAAQWAAPGSRRAGGRRSASLAHGEGAPIRHSLSEPLPLIPLRQMKPSQVEQPKPSAQATPPPRKPPSAASSIHAHASILSFHNVTRSPSLPGQPPPSSHSPASPLPTSRHSNPHLPHASPLRPGPPQVGQQQPLSSILHRAHSRSRAPSTAASRSHSCATSRATSWNGSVPEARSRAVSGTGEEGGEGRGGDEFLEMEAAPPTPVVEPEVIKSNSKRLVQLVDQRRQEAAAAAAAAGDEDEGGNCSGGEHGARGAASRAGVQREKVVGRKPKYSTAGLHGKALVDKALATIEKALRLLLKAQEEEQVVQQDGVAVSGSAGTPCASAADTYKQQAHTLRSLKREITQKGSLAMGDTGKACSKREGADERRHLLPPINLKAQPSEQWDPDDPCRPEAHFSAPQAFARPAKWSASNIRPSSEPKAQVQADFEDFSLVQAARTRMQQADESLVAGQRKSQQEPFGMDMEAKLRKGLRTAKKILKGLEGRHKESGQGGHSSECSPSEHSEEELTEQEQVYGKGIWGIVTNTAIGGRVAIPRVPATPEANLYTGAFGLIERQRKRLAAQQYALSTRNPVAYEEGLARQSEEQIRHLALEARKKLACAEVTSPDYKARDIMKSIRLLQIQRPFYLPPLETKEKVQRKTLEVSPVRQQEVWQISGSIFDARRQMSEAHDVIDTDKAKQHQFDLDYSRVAEKPVFQKLLKRIDESVRQNADSLEDEIQAVYEQMSAYKDQLRSIFIFYSCVASRFTSEDQGRMSLSSWLQFCNDACIMDNAHKGCTRADLATMFVAVKGGTDSKAHEAISDDAMMRFEFYEGIVRAAYGKFIEPRHFNDLSDAVVMIIEACVLPNVPHEALHDPNQFRNKRLYCKPVAELLDERWAFLSALFKLFKAKDRTRYFRVEHWGSFLEANKFLALQAGLDKRDAKLIFSWSQMSILDELRKRKRTVALTHLDFVEAVCRLAEHLALPSEAEVDHFFVQEQGIDPERIIQGLTASGRMGHIHGSITAASPTGAAVASAKIGGSAAGTPSCVPHVQPAPKAPWDNDALDQQHAPGVRDGLSGGLTECRPGAAPVAAASEELGALSASLREGTKAASDALAYSLKLQEFQRLIAISGQRRRRPSAGLLSLPSRGLEVKVDLLLKYVLGNMQRLYGGHDEADTARRMQHEATMISGGIELA